MSGIIYEGDLIVPIEYIDLYWSNKGQRGCDEKRLSIRFRIKPEYNRIDFLSKLIDSSIETNEMEENYEVCQVLKDIRNLIDEENI